MVRTWEEIKLVVDAANPTPTPTWFLHTDNPTHMHDDLALTRSEIVFDGVTYFLEGHIRGRDSRVGWHGLLVLEEETMRMTAVNESFTTWETCAVGIVRGLDVEFQKIRDRMTTEILAGEQLTEAGITAHAPSTLIKLDALTIGTEGERVIAVRPAFAPDVLSYTVTTSRRTPVTISVRTEPGAIVTWNFAGGSAEGYLFQVELAQAVNLVTVEVSKAGRTPIDVLVYK